MSHDAPRVSTPPHPTHSAPSTPPPSTPLHHPRLPSAPLRSSVQSNGPVGCQRPKGLCTGGPAEDVKDRVIHLEPQARVTQSEVIRAILMQRQSMFAALTVRQQGPQGHCGPCRCRRRGGRGGRAASCLEARKERRCLKREGSENRRQWRCLIHECSGKHEAKAVSYREASHATEAQSACRPAAIRETPAALEEKRPLLQKAMPQVNAVQ